jgi:hypothetical protein
VTTATLPLRSIRFADVWVPVTMPIRIGGINPA